MTAQELVAVLERRGMTIRVERGNLVLSGRTALLTDALRAELLACKPVLVRTLRCRWHDAFTSDEKEHVIRMTRQVRRGMYAQTEIPLGGLTITNPNRLIMNAVQWHNIGLLRMLLKMEAQGLFGG